MPAQVLLIDLFIYYNEILWLRRDDISWSHHFQNTLIAGIKCIDLLEFLNYFPKYYDNYIQ